jgi:hypothetical protein
MRTRVWSDWLVLVLVALMLTLTGVAYASPPDPSWIPGLYDDDDFDNVVDFIISSSGLAAALVISDLCPVPNPIVLQLPPTDGVVAFIPLSAFGPRAPPAA